METETIFTINDLNLNIDSDFEEAIPGGMTDEEFAQLETNILEVGEVLDSIKVWNTTIVDGHNRWKIIQKHPEIPFAVKQLEFIDKNEAIGWICRNQIGRRNLNPNQMSAVRAIAYKSEMHGSGGWHGNQYAKSDEKWQNCQNVRFASKEAAPKIANDFGVNERTIYRDVAMMDGVEAADEVVPGFKKDFMAGNIRAPKETFIKITSVPEEHREEVANALQKAGKSDGSKEDTARYRTDMSNAQGLIFKYTKSETSDSSDDITNETSLRFEHDDNTENVEFVEPAEIIESNSEEEFVPEPIQQETIMQSLKRSAQYELEALNRWFELNFNAVENTENYDFLYSDNGIEVCLGVVAQFKEVVNDYEKLLKERQQQLK